MKSFNKDIGNYGESLAYTFLCNNGYEVLSRNYRNRFGEIDIVCKEKNIIIFIEIKSRYSNSYGYPVESVTYHKQKQIIKVSSLFLSINKLTNYYVRYDIIEILFTHENNLFKINHLIDAFRGY